MTRRTRSRMARLRSLDRSRDRRREKQREQKQQDRSGANFIVGFGKYRGRRLLEIPLAYIEWILRTPGHILGRRAAREIDRRNRVREKARGTL